VGGDYGIGLPCPWLPSNPSVDRPPPSPPEVLVIDIGRPLFFDDFLLVEHQLAVDRRMPDIIGPDRYQPTGESLEIDARRPIFLAVGGNYHELPGGCPPGLLPKKLILRVVADPEADTKLFERQLAVIIRDPADQHVAVKWDLPYIQSRRHRRGLLLVVRSL
jgi:hypothetical protein